MTIGILFAVLAGLMLGLYALPEKYTKGYEFENTWGMMFFINMLIYSDRSRFFISERF